MKASARPEVNCTATHCSLTDSSISRHRSMVHNPLSPLQDAAPLLHPLTSIPGDPFLYSLSRNTIALSCFSLIEPVTSPSTVSSLYPYYWKIFPFFAFCTLNNPKTQKIFSNPLQTKHLTTTVTIVTIVTIKILGVHLWHIIYIIYIYSITS